ncbi:MAG: undecaprenyl-phosphate glucose phosphotransferase [Myxococcota bacterium]
MLYRYSEVFRGLLLFTDLLLVAAAWGLAYQLRFHTSWEVPLGPPDPVRYALAGLGIPLLFAWLFRARRLYEPQRTGSLLRETGAVIGASTMGVVLLLATDAAGRLFLSRSVIAVFWGLSILLVSANRVAVRAALRGLRRRGYNLRFVLVVGAGELAEQVIERVNAHPEAGLRVLGVLSDDPGRIGRSFQGVPVLAGYGAIKEVMRRQRTDQVLIALPRDESDRLGKILQDLDDEVASVRLVPDLLGVATLRSTVEELDGLPVISLRDGPFVGWAGVQKRAFDLILASLGLAVALPPMLGVALCVRLAMGRPIFYSQDRVGLDGGLFRMFKFRTMVTGAERESGPVWASAHDPRRTRLGGFLRRTSLDELPQLWNVLRGDMSLVGPRPERPIFIEEFRREIPGYMLRHKVRAGLTGWAQIHGWRGDTCLHERVEHDIYYIQNWSLGFDLRILLATLWRGWWGRNAS